MVTFQTNKRAAIHRGSDGDFPRKLHFAGRHRRRPQERRNGVRNGLRERFKPSHTAPLRKSYHCAVRLILASASPRRAELLRSAGYEFDIHAVDIDERSKPGELPAEYVERLAREKSARAIEELLNRGPANAGPRVQSDVASGLSDEVSGFSRTSQPVVLGADTAVVVGEAILGK